MNLFKYCLYITIINCTLDLNADQHQKMIVKVAATDLKGIPINNPSFLTLPTSAKTNPYQLTQLLFNEYVIAQKKYTDKQNKNWYLVKALQQPNKDKDGLWSGMLGWANADHLQPVCSFEKHNLVVTNLFADIYDQKNKKIITIFIGSQLAGTLDEKKEMYQISMPDQSYGWIKATDVAVISQDDQLSPEELRKNIVATTKKFLGNLYSWGGRTPQTDLLPVSSVDCSSFINLVFLAHGLLIPRNSVSQYLKAYPIEHGKDLQLGDLIFFANTENKINHVLLYTGNGKVIESSLTKQKVKESSLKKGLDMIIPK